MPLQGLGPLTFVWLVVFIALVLLTIPRLFEKRKSVPYYLLALGLWVVTVPVATCNIEWRDKIEIGQKGPNVFYLDTNSSRYNGLDLRSYSDVTLTLRDDNHFFVSRNTPFLRYLSGKWEYKDKLGIGFIAYSFDSLESSFFVSDTNIWTFDGPGLKDPDQKNLIVFRRR